MIRSSWLAARALIAIALMLGFYALAVSMAAGLFYIPYAEWVYANRIDLRIALFCVIAAGLILSSIIPRHQPFIAPGPRLHPADQPHLFERLTKLSRSVGQRMPGEVYLVSDLNAWVAQIGGTAGFGSRRVIGIGLPLLQVLTVSEFEAVLAHEFGHYHGGDTRLGPWIYKTRSAIGRTVESLTETTHGGGVMRLLRVPFVWYGHLFLRITHAVSRAQELSADRLAAEVVGAEPLADGLRAIHRTAGAHSYYFNNEALPVVQSGFSPPLAEGFASFLSTESIAKSMDENLRAELSSARVDAYDTHPPLVQRLAALADLPKGNAVDRSPALSLIENLPHVESALMLSWRPSDAPPLQPIQWSETGVAVLLPSWRKAASRSGSALKGIALEHVYDVASDLDPFARQLDVWGPGVPWNIVRQYASTMLASALACALQTNGWTIETAPGVLWMTHGTNRLNPFQVVSRIVSGELKKEEWQEMIGSFGLDPSMPLSPSNASPDTVPKQVASTCHACGIPYNPADYADASKMWCSGCGARLTKA